MKTDAMHGAVELRQKIAVMPRVATTWNKTATTRKNILIEEMKSTKKPTAKHAAQSHRQIGFSKFFNAK